MRLSAAITLVLFCLVELSFVDSVTAATAPLPRRVYKRPAAALQRVEKPTGADDSASVRLGLIFLIAGVANVDVDFRLSDQFTLGPTLTYGRLKNKTTSDGVEYSYDANLFRGGARLNWHPDGVYQSGFYSSSYLQYSQTSGTFSGNNGFKAQADVSGMSLGLVGGYQWFVNHINFTLGAGFTYLNSGGTAKIRTADGTTTEIPVDGFGFTLDIMTGYSF